MNLDGRRESSNVEDRRGMSGGKKAGLAGIGGVIIAMAIAYFTGGNPLEAGMQAFQENGGLGSLTGTNTEVNEGQMLEDVKLAIEGGRPVEFFGHYGSQFPTTMEITQKILEMKEGK